MKLYSLYLTYRNVTRIREILSVFIKYGFFNVAENKDLKKFIPFYKRFLGKMAKRYVSGGIEVQLRMVFEELGPTFIKFGQLLSRREDLLSSTLIEEFSKLEDKVTPIPFDKVQTIIKKQFKDVETLFKSINSVPDASASLAQVHTAILSDGEDVVLKIKRPDIEEIIQNDMIVLKFLSRFFDRHFPDFKYLKISEIINEFEKTMFKELNFFSEISNMERMSAAFADCPHIVIPKPNKYLSSKDIIVMEKIDSIKLVDKQAIDKIGVNLQELLKKGLKTFLSKLFKEGVYHGDLHMGNIGITYGGKIVLYDFGNIGFLTRNTRSLVKEFISTLITKDYEGLIERLIDLELVTDEKGLIGMEKELMDCFEFRLGLSLKQLDLPGLIKDILEICKKHKVNLPSELTGFFRTIIYIETIGKTCIPNFYLGELLSELFEENIFQKIDAGEMVKNTIKTLNDFKKVSVSFPRRIDKLLNKMINDKFIVDFYHMNLDPLTEEMKKSSNRISISLIVAALIIGSSLVFFSDKGPHIFGYPLLGIIGFIFSFFLGLYLLFGIIRS